MNSKRFHVLFINVLFLVFIIVVNNFYYSTSLVPSNATDHKALMSLKAELSSDPLQSLASWNESVNFCQWLGITCGRKHKRVIEINLSSKQLTGPLSPYVGNLSFLRVLKLDNNSFAGEITPQISRLSKLRVLWLEGNSFLGEIPSNISQCMNLNDIDLGGNNLVGTIPIEFQSLPKLEFILLDRNNLTGELPNYLGNFSALKQITLTDNKFGGNIPNSMGELAGLMHLEISVNNLSGTIPPSIFNLSNLVNIDMILNEIEGKLPSDLWLKLPELYWLNIGANRFRGSIPKSISNASKLEYLDMSTNGFTGEVPNLSKLQNLERFFVYENLLGNGEEGDLNFFSSLNNNTKLSFLGFYSNNLGGTFPTSFGNLSELTNLNIYNNPIHGRIPNDLGELVKLEVLVLGSNIDGSIPGAIGSLRELKILNLMENKLSGVIPNSLGNLTKLIGVDLSNNNLEGSIPPSLAKCITLSGLDLSGNNLSGTIPSGIFSLPTLTSILDLSSNHLVGPIVLVEQVSRSLNQFSVSNNMLSGEIPNNIGGYQGLSFLSLADNSFHGDIPPSLISLRALDYLDLSHNNLTGKIPEYLGTFQFLTGLDLSFNDLEGPVPLGGIFNNVHNFSIDKNNKLCGGAKELNLPKCYLKPGASKKFRVTRHLKYILPTCIGATAVLAIFLHRWRRSKRVSTSDDLATDVFPQVSYRDLYRATNGFSSTNFCGSGKFSYVYKGVLDQFETAVAVKVLKLDVEGAAKCFIAECNALRSIRHRNLVKILTLCSTIDFQGNDFKALVFSFMENGSLEWWLYYNARSLTLLERLNIVIDVACALDYLHNQSGILMVHCDVKPSNVLLDSDFVAHLGDFGLLEFLREATSSVSSTSHASSVEIKGTVGYAAPEYGIGSEISTYGDMYSFGILILEIFSGKRPTDDMFHDGLNLHNLAKMAIPDRVMEICDGQLLQNEGEPRQAHGNTHTQNNTLYDKVSECVASMFRIGVSCSVDIPRERLTIKDAIHELYLIKKNLLEGTILNQEEANP